MKSFFGGVPTAPDIKRIREQYPDENLKEGQFIDYDTIAGIIGVESGSSRFRTVTMSWRKFVRLDSRKIIDVERGKGFIVLNDNEKVTLSGKKIGRAVKQIKLSYKIVQATDETKLSEKARETYNFNILRAGKMIASAQIKSISQLPTMEKNNNG